jgi:hypothetical protein
MQALRSLSGNGTGTGEVQGLKTVLNSGDMTRPLKGRSSTVILSFIFALCPFRMVVNLLKSK